MRNPQALVARRLLALALAAMPLGVGCGSDSSTTEPATPAEGGTDTSVGGAGGSAGAGGTGGTEASAPEVGAGGKAGAAGADAAVDSSLEAASEAGEDSTSVDVAQEAGPGDWKKSLGACWTDPSCHRAMVIAHGGEWSATGAPFLSRKAFEQAFQSGADGIEADILVTMDGVAVVAHSSPIQYYESIDCGGKKIEEMTADQVTKCHLGASFSETIQRMDDVLDWSKGKLILEWDVKEAKDLAVVIQTILAKDAADRSTILSDPGEFQTVLPSISGWDSLKYIGDIGATTEVQPMLQDAAKNHVFLFEMDRSYGDATEAQVAELIKNVVNPGGIKAFGASDQYLATVQNHVDVYHQGFDVVLSYDVPNGVKAAQQVNAERGYVP